MPFNGFGLYTRIANAFTAPVDGEAAQAVHAEQWWDDITDALNGTIQKDGQCVMTGQFKAAAGTVGAPGITLDGDLDSGIYHIGANNVGFAVGGAHSWDASNIGFRVSVALLPITDGGATLGTPSNRFSTVYLSNASAISFNNDIIVQHSSDFLAFTGGAYSFDGPVRLGAVSTPAAPASGNLTLFAKAVSSREKVHYVDSAGRERVLGAPQLLGYAVAVDFNAVADTAIVLDVPYGEWRLSVVGIANTGATASLTAAQYGLFTSTGGGGVALVASGTAMSGLTSATVNTNGSYMQTAAAVSARLNVGTVYFRVTQAQGAAASGNVYVIGFELPTG